MRPVTAKAEILLSTASITTDGTGNASIPFIAAQPGQVITATATDSDGSTSEFSACIQVEAPVTPTVTVSAPDGVASEAGADTGTFTFTRAGPTTQPLDLLYNVGGTAVSGTDYTPPLTGAVTIPAGQTSVTVLITPLNDTAPEGDETIVVTLTAPANGSYAVGTPGAATVTISDDDGGSLVNGAMHIGTIPPPARSRRGHLMPRQEIALPCTSARSLTATTFALGSGWRVRPGPLSASRRAPMRRS